MYVEYDEKIKISNLPMEKILENPIEGKTKIFRGMENIAE